MKNKLLLGIFLLLGCASFGQQQLNFDYDAAGNQIGVVIILHNILDNKMSHATATTLQSNPIYKDVKYYPNPVKNELYMEWQTIDNNNLTHIVINNIAGDLLKDYKDVNTVTNYTLSFEGYPQGVYFVKFMYNNGEQKTFKIIKGE